MSNLTPTGRVYKPFIDPAYANCWITIADPMLVSNSLTDAQKQTLIVRACAMINRMCNRYFNKQEADEIFINDNGQIESYCTYVLANAPIVSITDIYLQLGDTFSVLDSTDNLQLFPDDGTIRLLPQPESLVGVQGVLAWQGEYSRSNMWIRYTSGYETVPTDVQLATAYMYNYLYAISQNPIGIIEFKTQTTSEKYGVERRNNPLLVAIDQLLTSYKKINVK